MKYAKIVFSLLALAFIVSGCGTKRQYFEPETLSGKLSYDGSLPASIVDTVRDGATLENGQVVTKKDSHRLFYLKIMSIMAKIMDVILLHQNVELW